VEEEEKQRRRDVKEDVRQAGSEQAEERAWSEELKREYLARQMASCAAASACAPARASVPKAQEVH
jgi:hypothetical protein